MHPLTLSDCFVSTAWLHQNLKHPHLVLLDASMKPITPPATPPEVRRIAGTQRFDFDKVFCDHKSTLPHMLPSAEYFEENVRALGINKESTVVIYDDVGLYASPRAWWMFKTMGFDRVAVLNGGLPAWIADRLPVVSPLEKNRTTIGNFIATFRPEFVASCTQVTSALENSAVSVVDARSPGRFAGTEPEPRPGLRSGHMPQAVNLPFQEVLEHGYLKKRHVLFDKFQKICGSRKQLIFTCGSGVTASILMLAATHAGYTQLCVYDGSWSEWGLPSNRKVAKNVL